MNRKFFACLALIALVCTATSVGAQDPNYALSLSDAAGPAGGSVNVLAVLDNNGMDVAGWSYGVCNDSALVQPTLVNDEDTASVKNGAAADFNEKATFPGGWTQGVVICFTGCAVLPAGSLGFGMASADYDIDGAAAEGSFPDAFSYCDTLGVPPVATVVVVNGASIIPATSGGQLDVIGVVPFRRGDANDDGMLNVADGVWMLNELFQSGPSTDCLGANDANNDGSYDSSDAIYVFNHQFLNGPEPAAPYPGCGATTLEDCTSYNSCP